LPDVGTRSVLCLTRARVERSSMGPPVGPPKTLEPVRERCKPSEHALDGCDMWRLPGDEHAIFVGCSTEPAIASLTWGRRCAWVHAWGCAETLSRRPTRPASNDGQPAAPRGATALRGRTRP